MPAQTTTLDSLESSVSTTHSPSWTKIVEQHVKGLRFGSVAITVHEGRVVQIEVSTKVRFEKAH